MPLPSIPFCTFGMVKVNGSILSPEKVIVTIVSPFSFCSIVVSVIAKSSPPKKALQDDIVPNENIMLNASKLFLNKNPFFITITSQFLKINLNMMVLHQIK